MTTRAVISWSNIRGRLCFVEYGATTIGTRKLTGLSSLAIISPATERDVTSAAIIGSWAVSMTLLMSADIGLEQRKLSRLLSLTKPSPKPQSLVVRTISRDKR